MTDAASSARSTVPVRGWRERALQTAGYELGGLLVVTPLWKLATSQSALESIALLAALSVTVMCWMALYNTAFDLIEARITGAVASARPHGRRILHAMGLEVTSMAATCPLVILMTGYDLLEALIAEVGLTIAYAIYGYFFHLGFDRLRPVAKQNAAIPASR
jgi:uncharacterized membrane protein